MTIEFVYCIIKGKTYFIDLLASYDVYRGNIYGNKNDEYKHYRIISYLIDHCSNIIKEDIGPARHTFLGDDHKIINFILSYCDDNELKEALMNLTFRKNMECYLLKRDLSQYPVLVQIYRELGVDLFDLLEKEQ